MWQNFKTKFANCLQNVQLGSKEETFWRPIKAYSSIRLLFHLSLTICLDMEQFVLVLVSVYNKNLINQSVTKQELPKYQLLQNLTYQIVSLKKEISKHIFCKADSLVDKILSCPPVKLSNSQTSILIGVEIWVFLLDFAQQLCRKIAEIPDIYFILLDAASIFPTLIRNQNAKAKVKRS